MEVDFRIGKMFYLLLLLAILGATDCLIKQPQLVCWVGSLDEIPLKNSLCTHVIYKAFSLDMNHDGSVSFQKPTGFPSFKDIKRENSIVKMIPYFPDISIPYCNRYSSSWRETDDLDGIAFSVDKLMRCGTKYFSNNLNVIAPNRENFTRIAYFPAGSSIPSKDVQELLSTSVDLIDLHSSLNWKLSRENLLKTVFSLRLQGKLVYEEKSSLVDIPNSPKSPEVPYEKICKVIESEGLTPEWKKETDSPFIRRPEGVLYFENRLSVALKAREALKQGYAGVSLVLSEDDGSGSCGEMYPLTSAVRNELFPPSPIDLFDFSEWNSSVPSEVKVTVSYCMWKSSLNGSSAVDMTKIAGCTYIGFEPRSKADKGTMERLSQLQVSNPLTKIVLAMNAQYFLWETFSYEDLISYMRSYKIEGLDIILNSGDLDEDDILIVSNILDKIKDSRRGCRLFFILSIRDSWSSIYHSRNLLRLSQTVDYVNIAHFYSYDAKFPLNLISAAPLSSSSDFNNIVFAINYAILEGVPAKKILLGIPNFGYSYSIDDAKSLKKISFAEVCDLMENSNVTTGWDTFSATPYVNSSDTFVTYENSTSIQMKLEFTTRLGLGGVSLFWIDSEECEGVSDDGKTASNQIEEYILSANNRSLMCLK